MLLRAGLTFLSAHEPRASSSGNTSGLRTLHRLNEVLAPRRFPHHQHRCKAWKSCSSTSALAAGTQLLHAGKDTSYTEATPVVSMDAQDSPTPGLCKLWHPSSALLQRTPVHYRHSKSAERTWINWKNGAARIAINTTSRKGVLFGVFPPFLAAGS